MLYKCFHCANADNPEVPGYKEWVEAQSDTGFVLATRTIKQAAGPLPCRWVRLVLTRRLIASISDPYDTLISFENWLKQSGELT